MPKIEKRTNPQAVAAAFAKWFCNWIGSLPAEKSKINVALSGGSTPKLLFELWATEYCDKIDWNRVHFFWGDERCVASDDPESNFGTAKRLFLDHIEIDPENVHRIRGESDPEQEAGRYEDEVRSYVPSIEPDWPNFDLILLGMGNDGHTASIFPNEMELLTSVKVCEVATHPASGQKRITLTGRVLNAANCVTILVVGQSKREVLSAVLGKRDGFECYPISYVNPPTGELMFFVDEAATGA